MDEKPKVCEHGSLKRSCEICERDERIAELEADRDRLAAEVERLQEEMKFAMDDRAYFRTENAALRERLEEWEDLGIQADKQAQIEALEDRAEKAEAENAALRATVKEIHIWGERWDYLLTEEAFQALTDLLGAPADTAAPAPRQWTTTEPADPGWYFWRNKDHPEPIPVEIRLHAHGTVWITPIPVDEDFGEWWPAPIAPPGDKGD